MSKYLELRTKLTEEQYLVEALRGLGYNPEVCAAGTPLIGYMGDERAERAQVVIRRRHLDSASNDIGFARDGSGVYQAIISEYDRGIGFDDAWLGRTRRPTRSGRQWPSPRPRDTCSKAERASRCPRARRFKCASLSDKEESDEGESSRHRNR